MTKRTHSHDEAMEFILGASSVTVHWRPTPAPPNSTNPVTDPIAAAVAVGHHASDCARHNLPALPAGACDCGADIPLEVEMRRHAEGGFGALTDLTLSLLFMGADEIARLRAAVAAENEACAKIADERPGGSYVSSERHTGSYDDCEEFAGEEIAKLIRARVAVAKETGV